MPDKRSEVRLYKHHTRGQILYSQKRISEASVEQWRQQLRRGADRGAERASELSTGHISLSSISDVHIHILLWPTSLNHITRETREPLCRINGSSSDPTGRMGSVRALLFAVLSLRALAVTIADRKFGKLVKRDVSQSARCLSFDVLSLG